MGFDYHWTCPDIDQTIDQLNHDIHEEVVDAVESLCGFNCTDDQKTQLLEHTERIYNLISGSVEKIRDTNSDMRKAAEDQIDSLKIDLDEAAITDKEFVEKIKEIDDMYSRTMMDTLGYLSLIDKTIREHNQVTEVKPDQGACSTCGSKMVNIRGRAPMDKRRDICPTCAVEKLEDYEEQQALGEWLSLPKRKGSDIAQHEF